MFSAAWFIVKLPFGGFRWSSAPRTTLQSQCHAFAPYSHAGFHAASMHQCGCTQSSCCRSTVSFALNSQLREAVRAPLLGAYSVVNDEQSVGIVFSLDFSEPRIVAAPVCLLKSLLEVIALAHVRSTVRRDRAKFIHALIDALSTFPARIDRRLMPGNSGIDGSCLGVSCNNKRKGRQHRGIGAGVPRRRDRIGRCARQPLVEVHLET